MDKRLVKRKRKKHATKLLVIAPSFSLGKSG